MLFLIIEDTIHVAIYNTAAIKANITRRIKKLVRVNEKKNCSKNNSKVT